MDSLALVNATGFPLANIPDCLIDIYLCNFVPHNVTIDFYSIFIQCNSGRLLVFVATQVTRKDNITKAFIAEMKTECENHSRIQ